jgi:hypothetical protein
MLGGGNYVFHLIPPVTYVSQPKICVSNRSYHYQYLCEQHGYTVGEEYKEECCVGKVQQLEKDMEGLNQSTRLLSLASVSADEDHNGPLYNFSCRYDSSFLFSNNVMFIFDSE